MHPSLQHKYSLRTAEDVAIAERMISAAAKAGWSDRQIHDFLQFYGTIVPAFESGHIDGKAVLEQLSDFARLQGVGDEQREALIKWHGETQSFIANNGALPPLEKTSPQAAAAELHGIEVIQKNDPSAYWSDPRMQHRYHDLIEMSLETGRPPPIANQQNIDRMHELEGMMGSHESEYWRGPKAAALQSEYRNILSLGAPSETGAESALGPTASFPGSSGEG